MKAFERCPACDGPHLAQRGTAADVEGYQSEPFALLRCASCGLVCASPFLDDDEAAPYYDAPFYGSPGVVGTRLQRKFLTWRAHRLAAHVRPPARVLDVGCGDGGFLCELRQRGYRVVGYEPSAAGRASARARGLDVRGDLDHDENSVDAVTLWQVLEHVSDPHSLLTKVTRALSPSGVLLVSVPNFGSAQARVFGDRWFHLDVPRHVLHFDARSLDALLSRHGFHVIASSTRSLEYNVFGLVQSALNALPTKKNALYRVVKRGAPVKSFDPATRLAVTASLACLPALAAAAGAIGVVEEALGNGATLTVVARR